jgi:hypothetical protein
MRKAPDAQAGRCPALVDRISYLLRTLTSATCVGWSIVHKSRKFLEPSTVWVCVSSIERNCTDARSRQMNSNVQGKGQATSKSLLSALHSDSCELVLPESGAGDDAVV